MKSKIFILLLFFCCKLYSHSGRTDKDGGHFNRTTGEYHYHNKNGGFGNVLLGAISIFIFIAIFGKNGKRK